MQDSLFMLAVGIPIFFLCWSLYWLDRVRRREALFRWASENGYRLVDFRQPILTEASPFPFSASKSQHVFKIDVEDQKGDRRSGWIRLGSAWLGLASRAAEVRWK